VSFGDVSIEVFLGLEDGVTTLFGTGELGFFFRLATYYRNREAERKRHD
jgi:hypothetical protein